MNKLRSLLIALALVSLGAVARAATVTVTIASTTASKVSGPLLMQKGEAFDYTVTGTATGTVILEKSVKGLQYDPTGTSVRNIWGSTSTASVYTDGTAYFRFRVSTITAGSFVLTLADTDDFVQSFKNHKNQNILNLYDDSVRVPGALYVTGATNLTGAMALSGAVTATSLAASGNVTAAKVGIGNTSPVGLLQISTGTSATSLYVSTYSLLVGIGTASPATALHVVGAGRFYNGSAYANISNDGSATYYGGSGTVYLGDGSTGSQLGLRSSANGINMNDNNTNKITMAVGGGNVGVGSDSTPDAKLEIAAAAATTYSLLVSSANGTTAHLTVDSRDGLTYPQSLDSTGIQALAPKAAGGLIFNSTIVDVCVSTGTGAGAFKKLVDGTTCW